MVDAYYTAPETELIWGRPLDEYLDQRQAVGLSRDVMWKFLR